MAEYCEGLLKYSTHFILTLDAKSLKLALQYNDLEQPKCNAC